MKNKMKSVPGIVICSIINFVALLVIAVMIGFTAEELTRKETQLDGFMKFDIELGRYAEAYSDYYMFRNDIELMPDEETMAPYVEFVRFYECYINYTIDGDAQQLKDMNDILNSTSYRDNVPHYQYILGLIK